MEKRREIMTQVNINKFKLIEKLKGEIDYKELETYLCRKCKNMTNYCRNTRIPIQIKWKNGPYKATNNFSTVFTLYLCHSQD